MTYLVMENHTSYSVVLDEEGRFLNVANMGHQVGERIDSVIRMEEGHIKRFPTKTVVGVIGSLAAVFVLVFVLVSSMAVTPYATIYYSVNPQVKMQVAQDGELADISAMNEDGTLLLDGYSWRNKNVGQVSLELTARAMELGLLGDGGMVTLDIDAPEEAWFVDTGIVLHEQLEEALSGREITVRIRKFEKDDDQTPVVTPSPTQDTTRPPQPVPTDQQPDGTQTPKPTIDDDDDDDDD
ncbi:hypothetical protein LJC55_01585 [Eubacteriales bacterium OttesenSCG-928-N14]|nr:hypothetical protein [Eubacteriales bacterium OttesenSCG-928-N14]